MEQNIKGKIPQLAARYFQGQEGYNCAQAVLAISHELIGTTDNNISQATAWGGGRAENGYCGALYGALSLCPQEMHQEIIDEFNKRVGATRCREIRPYGLKPCQECVAIGSELVTEKLSNIA